MYESSEKVSEKMSWSEKMSLSEAKSDSRPYMFVTSSSLPERDQLNMCEIYCNCGKAEYCHGIFRMFTITRR